MNIQGIGGKHGKVEGRKHTFASIYTCISMSINIYHQRAMGKNNQEPEMKEQIYFSSNKPNKKTRITGNNLIYLSTMLSLLQGK